MERPRRRPLRRCRFEEEEEEAEEEAALAGGPSEILAFELESLKLTRGRRKELEAAAATEEVVVVVVV
jgi:hypothetical protein